MTDKVFTSAQIKDCDAYSITAQNITSEDLMQHAAMQCFEFIAKHYNKETPFLVLCGMGNNGGDGLALSRILLQDGYTAKAIVLRTAEEFSSDASYHFKLLHQLAPENVNIVEEGFYITDLPERIVLVDAILGAGLSRPLNGWIASFIEEINHQTNQVISIDLPTGLPADRLATENDVVIEATHTLSFQFYKRSFLHPESEKYVGIIHLLDIGLSEKFINDTHSQYRIITPEIIKSIYKPRKRFSHKGTYGKAMLLGGSYGKIGAVVLSTQAALRSGAGLVYSYAPACGYEILQTSAPEAMVITNGSNYIEHIEFDEDITIGLGPGLGTIEQTQNALYNFLEKIKKPIIVDADALNLISKNIEIINLLPPHSIITPHPKEFERLFGKTADSMMQVEWGRGIAMKHNIVIVLKGHRTAVLLPNGDCWYNITGNAGMATGGSGDVLTGILTSLLAQGYTVENAALLGVYIHGRSGDIVSNNTSQESLIASDIIQNMGKVFLEIGSSYTNKSSA